MAVSTNSLALPMIPTANGVVFPDMVVNVVIDGEEALNALASAADANAADPTVILVASDGDRFSSVGSIAEIVERGELPNGQTVVTVRAVGRADIGAGVVGTGPGLWVEARPVDIDGDANASPERAEATAAYRTVLDRIVELFGKRRFSITIPETDDAGVLADLIAYWPELTQAQRIELIETIDIDERLALATSWATKIAAELEVGNDIHDGVNKAMEADQRQAILRRQLAAIREELGEGSEDTIGEYRSKLDELTLPDTVEKAISTEIDRLERMGEQSQEAGWIRTWLDTVFEIPFNEQTTDNFDLKAARGVLDADHYGLDDVKDRLIEHLAVRKLRSERGVDEAQRASGERYGTTILALAGPPGVGKTSLGASIASALGRKFVRMALGGIRDEAEIRGHRRTYVGARPGRIARALIEAGSMNPIVLLDEIDKIGADYRGDPSAALLEVLDPAQNHSFRDHYLEFDLDLSDVIFIATANQLQAIPGPLLDRVEVITIDGYTDDEKASIAIDHLLPRLLSRHGLADDEITITDSAIAEIASEWTREPGVRNLERKLDRVVRKSVTKIATGDAEAPVAIDADDLIDLLGKPIPRDELVTRTSTPGVASGLAVTGAGGDVLFVEATSMEGDAGLTLTGQLGEVMRESGEIALSYLRSHADELGLSGFDKRFHVHFPAGAIPKDGPSAGITMTTALASLLSGRCVRPEVAMTGEMTLHGAVLPIGGVKQKLLAAHRDGVTEVVLPARNERDLDDVPDEVREALTVHLVTNIAEVLDSALAPAEPQPDAESPTASATAGAAA